MAFTQAQLDALESAIASGVTSVSYEGKSTSFRSLDEMLRLRDAIRRALGLDTTSRTILIQHDRGYGGGGSEG